MEIRRSRATIAIWSTVAAGLLVVAIPIVFAVYAIPIHRALNAELALIEAAGEPATPAQLARLYAQPPADQDATPYWLEAIRELEAISNGEVVPVEDVTYPSPGGVWPDVTHAEQLVTKYRAALDRFHEAAERGGTVRFPINLGDGYGTGLPHGIPLNQAAILLANEAAVKGYGGDTAGMLRAIRTMFAVSRSLEGDRQGQNAQITPGKRADLPDSSDYERHE